MKNRHPGIKAPSHPPRFQRIVHRASDAFLFLFFSIVSCLPQVAYADSNMGERSDCLFLPGPITIPNQHPVALRHLSFEPEIADPLPQGCVSLNVENSLSNTVNREEGSFLIDAESREVRLNMNYGFQEGLELRASQALLWEGPGFTDHSIDEWHKFFGFPRGPRRRLKKDQFIIFGNNNDGSSFEQEEQGTHFGDLDISLKHLVFSPSENPLRASLRFTVRLPTGEKAYGQQSVDTEIAALAEYSLERVHFHGGFALTHLFDPESDGLQYADNVFAGFVGVSFLINNQLNLYFGLNPASTFLSGVEQFPEYQLYFDTALAYQFTKQLQGNFLIRENPSPEDSTTDITLSLGLTYRFTVGLTSRNVETPNSSKQ